MGPYCPAGVPWDLFIIQQLHAYDNGMAQPEQPAKQTGTATEQPGRQNPPYLHPRNGRTPATVAIAKERKLEPTWNRLRSKPGWFSKQVHVLRGLQPRAARMQTHPQGMCDLWESGASRSHVPGESGKCRSDEDSLKPKTSRQNSEPRENVLGSIAYRSPDVVLSRMRGCSTPSIVEVLGAAAKKLSLSRRIRSCYYYPKACGTKCSNRTAPLQTRTRRRGKTKKWRNTRNCRS